MIKCVLYFQNVLYELCYRLSFVLTEDFFFLKNEQGERLSSLTEAYQLLTVASVRCRNVVQS